MFASYQTTFVRTVTRIKLKIRVFLPISHEQYCKNIFNPLHFAVKYRSARHPTDLYSADVSTADPIRVSTIPVKRQITTHVRNIDGINAT